MLERVLERVLDRLGLVRPSEDEERKVPLKLPPLRREEDEEPLQLERREEEELERLLRAPLERRELEKPRRLASASSGVESATSVRPMSAHVKRACSL